MSYISRLVRYTNLPITAASVKFEIVCIYTKDRICVSAQHYIPTNIDVNDGDDFSTLYSLYVGIYTYSVIAYNTPAFIVIKRKYTLSSHDNPMANK